MGFHRGGPDHHHAQEAGLIIAAALVIVWTAVGVVVGIAAVAIGVALNILWEGGNLMWRASQGLMDEAVETDVLRAIQKALEDFDHDTIRFDHATTRRSGQRRFVDLHMPTPANWLLGRAAEVCTNVEQSLMHAVLGLRAMIQLLPGDVEAHFGDLKDLP